MIKTWKANFLSFWDTRIVAIFCFGFSSGIPFLLTLSTLSIWLKESGVSNATIGLFVLVTLPYALKFLWGPFVDKTRIPFLFAYLGRRRSWAFISQLGLILSLMGLGSSHPTENIWLTALWALAVAMFSALQDIAVEAYRIESVAEDRQGTAASAMTLGWRFGLLTSGAGALFFATFFSWQFSYTLMASLISIGILTSLLSPSEVASSLSPRPLQTHSLKDWFFNAYCEPFMSLLRSVPWPLIFTFILLFKVGDTVLSTMNGPFLTELGFTKVEIAHTTKIFGVGAMIIGGLMGGLFLNQFGILPSLITATLAQFLACLLFAAQALMGHNIALLTLVVGVENLSGGFGATALIVYLSTFCHPPYTATHFALLASIGSFVRVGLSIGAGILADKIAWSLLFTLTAIGCLPCLCLLLLPFRHKRKAFPYSS